MVGDGDKARAVWFAGPREAEIRDEVLSPRGEDDLLVESIASLVSPGTEMNVYRGESATPEELALPTAAGEYPFPIKFAYQSVGRVIEAGPKSGYREGDVVFAVHPHQDRFVITGGRTEDGLIDGAALVCPVPESLDPTAASFANLFSVAYNAMLDVPVRIGDCVAVSGLGVIGNFAAHLARLTADKLILVDPIPQRRERAAWVGADAVVGPEDLGDAVEEHTEGRGVDVFVEASGATPALQGAIDNTGQEGTIVVVSYYGNRIANLRLSPEFHLRRQRIVSSMVGVVGSGLQPRWDVARRMRVAMGRLSGLDIEQLISHRIPFERAPEAYPLIDEHPESSLGVVLEYHG
jgi:2-desacetyl-2-hydroxyethyl bacteriochlorophyllide A dehydrogenase